MDKRRIVIISSLFLLALSCPAFAKNSKNNGIMKTYMESLYTNVKGLNELTSGTLIEPYKFYYECKDTVTTYYLEMYLDKGYCLKAEVDDGITLSNDNVKTIAKFKEGPIPKYFIKNTDSVYYYDGVYYKEEEYKAFKDVKNKGVVNLKTGDSSSSVGKSDSYETYMELPRQVKSAYIQMLGGPKSKIQTVAAIDVDSYWGASQANYNASGVLIGLQPIAKDEKQANSLGEYLVSKVKENKTPTFEDVVNKHLVRFPSQTNTWKAIADVSKATEEVDAKIKDILKYADISSAKKASDAINSLYKTLTEKGLSKENAQLIKDAMNTSLTTNFAKANFPTISLGNGTGFKWNQDNTGWWYGNPSNQNLYLKNGWYLIPNDGIYHFNESGYMTANDKAAFGILTTDSQGYGAILGEKYTALGTANNKYTEAQQELMKNFVVGTVGCMKNGDDIETALKRTLDNIGAVQTVGTTTSGSSGLNSSSGSSGSSSSGSSGNVSEPTGSSNKTQTSDNKGTTTQNGSSNITPENTEQKSIGSGSAKTDDGGAQDLKTFDIEMIGGQRNASISGRVGENSVSLSLSLPQEQFQIKLPKEYDVVNGNLYNNSHYVPTKEEIKEVLSNLYANLSLTGANNICDKSYSALNREATEAYHEELPAELRRLFGGDFYDADAVVGITEVINAASSTVGFSGGENWEQQSVNGWVLSSGGNQSDTILKAEFINMLILKAYGEYIYYSTYQIDDTSDVGKITLYVTRSLPEQYKKYKDSIFNCDYLQVDTTTKLTYNDILVYLYFLDKKYSPLRNVDDEAAGLTEEDYTRIGINNIENKYLKEAIYYLVKQGMFTIDEIGANFGKTIFQEDINEICKKIYATVNRGVNINTRVDTK